jgi:purine-binding chemotaxis protein CheW
MSPRPPRRRGSAGKTGATGPGDGATGPGDGGRGSAPAPGNRSQAVSLPASGLAQEILAAYEQRRAAAAGAPEPLPEAVRAESEAGTAPPAASPAAPSVLAPQPKSAPEPKSASEPQPAPRSGAAPPPAAGPARIYSFADSLERHEAAPAAPVERPESWVTFELAGELYALPVARIQEIQRARAITRVPHAPAPVRGIANLRGRVLVVVDLRQRLNLPPAALDERSRILVVSSRERSLGLLVDAAHQVVGLLPSRIEPPPADLVDERSAYLAGVVQLDEKLVIALDIDQLLLVPEGGDPQPQPEAGGPP